MALSRSHPPESTRATARCPVGLGGERDEHRRARVNPAATGGGFPSPFARLPFADKAAVWRILEQDTRQVTDSDPSHSFGVLQFVFGVLPAFVGFFAFSEIDVFDPATRTVKRRPVGWDHCGYLGDRAEDHQLAGDWPYVAANLSKVTTSMKSAPSENRFSVP
jgi:hypothetical protein